VILIEKVCVARVPAYLGLVGEHMKTAWREIIGHLDTLQASPLGQTPKSQSATSLQFVWLLVKIQETPQIVP
jgi:hypothetical protein